MVTLQQVLTSDLVRSCKMEKVTFIQVETPNGVTEHAIIDRGNGEFTSMTKAHYEAQQVALSTPIATEE